MSKIQTKSESPSTPKVVDHQMGRQLISVKLAADVNVETGTLHQTSAIFNLNIDCFAKIFDYLSLFELINVAQTCKLLHKVAGYVFQLHYPYANAIIDNDGMHLENHGEVQHCVTTFSEYIQCIVFSDVMNDNTLRIQWHRFKSIKRVNFYYARFRVQKINLLKDILKNVQIVELSDCSFDSNMFEYFLELCKNIKHLIITINYDYNADWLTQKYPHLECVSIAPIVCIWREIYELSEFFKQNRNVTKFFTSSKFLLDNRAFIQKAKFDQLKVQVGEFDFGTVCALLNELYAKGVCKRFYITFFDCFKVNQPFIDQLNSINALVGLRIPFHINDLDLNTLVNLEILRFDCNINKIINMSQLPQNLTNLREISFIKASIDDILPFVYQLPKLRKIAVEKLIDFRRRGIDLLAVNEKRKKLFEISIHVSKIIIYVPEMVYLRSRSKFMTMNFDLVEILRYELFDNSRF